MSGDEKHAYSALRLLPATVCMHERGWEKTGLGLIFVRRFKAENAHYYGRPSSHPHERLEHTIGNSRGKD